MNIGFVYGMKTYPPGTGGSVHGYQLAKGLTSRGHNLYTWYYDDGESPFCKHFRGREFVKFRRTVDVLYLRINWAQLMRRWDPWQLLIRSGLPTIYEVNGLPDQLRLATNPSWDPDDVVARLRQLAKRGHAAIAVSELIREFLENEIGFRVIYCIPNGSDPNLFSPASERWGANRPLQIVWIGSSRAGWHDLDSIVNMARILDAREANVQVRIYGDPAFLPAKLPSNVQACGVIPYTEMGAQIGDADVGLLVFRVSGQANIDGSSPLKLFDYMACELAILTQSYGQRGRIIEDWNNGLITTGTPEDLADKIQILDQDRDLCVRLGQNGRRAVCEYYNWQRVSKETESALVDALKN